MTIESRNDPIYDTTHIKVLKGLEAIRKRASMYIGDTEDGTGLHNMIYEVVDDAIDEALAGFATEVTVVLNADGSATVRDDGRGIPTDLHPEEGNSAAEAAMTRLHAGGMILGGQDDTPYRIGGNLRGMGLSIVNALSDRLELRIWRDGKEHLVRFRDGAAEGPLGVVGPAAGRHGTEITFWPRPETFHTVTRFDRATLERRLRELAFLNPGLRVVLKDDRPAADQPQVMRYPGGLSDFVRHLDRARTPLLDTPIVIAGEQDGVGVEVALWWNDSDREQALYFTNNIPQREGGSHLGGFQVALLRAIATLSGKTGIPENEKEMLAYCDAGNGLTAVISVNMSDPRFSGPTKDLLVACEVTPVVADIVSDRLAAWFERHPAEARLVLDKALASSNARNTAHTASVLAVRASPQAHIGDTGDGTGLLNLVYEVLDYALDHYAAEIAVSLNADGSATVRHDGNGLDTFVPDDGRLSQAESIATHRHGPVEFLRNRYRVPGNLERATLAAVNALSSCLEIRIWRDGQEHLVRFRDGLAEGRIKAVGPAEGKQGMEITFWPSLEVFHPVTDFDYVALERRLHELAAIDPGLRIVLDDRRPAGKRLERICHGGFADLVRFLDRSRKPLLDAPVVIRSDTGDYNARTTVDFDCWIGFEVALWWNDGASEQVACYTDGLPRHVGGSHRDRLLAAVGRVLARYAQEHGEAGSPKVPIVGEDAQPGLTAVVALQRYAYWTPISEEGLDDMAAVVEHIVAEQLSAWLEAHPKEAQAILAKLHKSAAGRAIGRFAGRRPLGAG